MVNLNKKNYKQKILHNKKKLHHRKSNKKTLIKLHKLKHLHNHILLLYLNNNKKEKKKNKDYKYKIPLQTAKDKLGAIHCYA